MRYRSSSPSIAAIAASRDPMVTNPHPLDWLVRRSLKTLTSSTGPKRAKSPHMSDSVTLAGARAKNSWRLSSGPAPAWTYWWLRAKRTWGACGEGAGSEAREPLLLRPRLAPPLGPQLQRTLAARRRQRPPQTVPLAVAKRHHPTPDRQFLALLSVIQPPPTSSLFSAPGSCTRRSKWRIAASASSLVAYETKAHPRGCPVALSLRTIMSLTAPHCGFGEEEGGFGGAESVVKSRTV
jgi:hypothetical protein